MVLHLIFSSCLAFSFACFIHILTYCRTVVHVIWFRFNMDISMFKQTKPQNENWIHNALPCFNITHSHMNGAEHTMTEKKTEHMLNKQESSKEHAKHAASKFHHQISHESDAYAFQIPAIYIDIMCVFLCMYFGLVLFSHSPKLFFISGSFAEVAMRYVYA